MSLLQEQYRAAHTLKNDLRVRGNDGGDHPRMTLGEYREWKARRARCKCVGSATSCDICRNGAA